MQRQALIAIVALSVVSVGPVLALRIAEQPLELLTVGPSGLPGDRQTGAVSGISADGRIVCFESDATNLLGMPVDGLNVYCADRLTGTLELVTRTAAGAAGGGWAASLSADGRFVAFHSPADLLENEVPPQPDVDVFVWDRVARTMERTCVAPIPPEFTRQCTQPALSGDGRFVAFGSQGIPASYDSASQVFVRDRIAHTTVRASRAPDGAPGNRGSVQAAISSDGRVVAFVSLATNLVDGDTNGVNDVFVFDRDTTAVTRVSVATDGTEANADCFGPVLSADGRFVLFWSEATTLVPDDTNGVGDVFLHDRVTGVTERVGVSSSGEQGDRQSDISTNAMSADGRWVTFASAADGFAPGDVGHWEDVFVRDRTLGTTLAVSVASDRALGNWHSFTPVISADSRSIAFASEATNLTGPQSYVTSQVLVRTIGCDHDIGRPWEHCPTTTVTSTTSTTSTTAPTCSDARCVMDGALDDVACTGGVPAGVTRKIALGLDRLGRAQQEHGRKRTRSLRAAGSLLRAAAGAAKHAATRRRPKIGRDCADTITAAITQAIGRYATP